MIPLISHNMFLWILLLSRTMNYFSASIDSVSRQGDSKSPDQIVWMQILFFQNPLCLYGGDI